MNLKNKLNICGFGKRKWGLPFDYVIQAECKVHDNNYKKGGGVSDRLQADLGFLWRILADINKIPNQWKKRLYILIAIIYFILIRLFGWVSYYPPQIYRKYIKKFSTKKI